MSAETTTYNVYRVSFTQTRGPDHEAIALVPAQNEDQGAGRFYEVVGLVGMGMDYRAKPAYRFNTIPSFKTSTVQFQLPKAQLSQFEDIAKKCPPPYDPRALTGTNHDPPVRNCSSWVDEVLAEAKGLVE